MQSAPTRLYRPIWGSDGQDKSNWGTDVPRRNGERWVVRKFSDTLKLTRMFLQANNCQLTSPSNLNQSGSQMIRKKLLASLPWFVTAWLAACGGGGDESSTATTNSTKSAIAVQMSNSSMAKVLVATGTVEASSSAMLSQAVNLQDAIAILKIIVGLEVNGSGQGLTPFQAYAADVDGNGKVELSDAIAVLKRVVGLDSPVAKWLFFNQAGGPPVVSDFLNPGLPPDLTAVVSPSTATNVGLVAVLRGDVVGTQLNYSWALTAKPTSSNAVPTDTTAAVLAFKADQVGSYVARLTVTDGNSNIASTEVTLTAVVIVQLEINAAPAIINLGSDVALTWHASNAIACVAQGDWTNSIGRNGSLVIKPTSSGVKNYILNCDGNLAFTSINVVAPKFYMAPSAVYKTSYENLKKLDIGQIKFPEETIGSFNDGPLAYALADFDKTNRLSLLTVTQLYTQFNLVGAKLQFWSQDGFGGWKKLDLLAAGSESCLHPRKAIVADFNQDGRPDVFVACHGWDYDPYPGEPGLIIMSQADGKYQAKKIAISGYFHGATAADLNGDGFPDILVTDPNAWRNFEDGRFYVTALINDKSGNFYVEKPDAGQPNSQGIYFSMGDIGRLPNGGDCICENPFSIELIDVNADGKPDLLLGYAGGFGASLTMNNGFNHFRLNPSDIFPADLGWGWAVDFTFGIKNGERFLYINRTGDGGTSKAGFYDGSMVQKYSLDKNSYVNIYNSSLGIRYGAPWIPWFVPVFSDGLKFEGIVPFKSIDNSTNFMLN